jgi:hypothetical protein
MKILKTLITFTDANLGIILKCDTIEFEGKYWLVPEWLENATTGKMQPLRIICLDLLPHQKTSLVDFVLNDPIPKCVFDGEIPVETTLNFQIVESPQIWVDIPKQSKLH